MMRARVVGFMGRADVREGGTQEANANGFRRIERVVDDDSGG